MLSKNMLFTYPHISEVSLPRKIASSLTGSGNPGNRKRKQEKIQSHHGQLLWVWLDPLPGPELQCAEEGVPGKWREVRRRQVPIAADASRPRGPGLASTSRDL